LVWCLIPPSQPPCPPSLPLNGARRGWKRDVAIKLLHNGSEIGAGERLLHEARAVAQLSHPNIVNVYDAGILSPSEGLEGKETTFIVMEWVQGTPLSACQLPLSMEQTLSIAHQICAALQHAHEHGIIHRDLKPENVTLMPDGRARLMDFGLAHSLASRLTSQGMIIGTVFYLAPEQALGQPLERIVRGRMVGRQAELAEMTACWQRVQAGQSEEIVLLLSGEPGIGKTRLLKEMITRANVARALVLQGECYAESSVPYAPFAAIIRQGLAVAQGKVDIPEMVLADLVDLAPDQRPKYPWGSIMGSRAFPSAICRWMRIIPASPVTPIHFPSKCSRKQALIIGGGMAFQACSCACPPCCT